MNKDLAKRLKELRQDKGISKNELAVKTGASEKEITMWENGETYPDGAQLVKLSQAYNMTIDEILLNFDTDIEPEHENVSENKKDADTENITIPTAKQKSFNWYAFPYPIIVLLAYLGLGFMFHIWHPTWILFLTIPVYYMMVTVSNAKTFTAKANVFPYPIIITILYLAIGFDYGVWHPAWLLFLTIPIYYMAVAMFSSRR